MRISLDSVIYSKFQNEKYDSIEYDWIIFDEMLQEGNLNYIKKCTMVSSLAVALFSGQLKTSEQTFKEIETSCKVDETNNDHITHYKIDNWINFKVDKKVIKFLFS